jgi:hypothetical protein
MLCHVRCRDTLQRRGQPSGSRSKLRALSHPFAERLHEIDDVISSAGDVSDCPPLTLSFADQCC